ncbi:unnamed protein product [Rotaria socialis]|uniref:Uncharacterized protein n=1 Tax=Rotaria socialis TaxID=392032 RepID=A0A820U6J1_9BILA|nr:unnamed protein product [Rotaria socialis]
MHSFSARNYILGFKNKEQTNRVILCFEEKASNELRTNALSSVRYVEVCLPSCHDGYNKANHIGKHLVPFLSTYMPRLQTLRLWRSDDFLWTSSKFILSKQN